jgi:hypothetical protein
MRQEIIDYLIRNNIEVTEYNIGQISNNGFNSSAIDTVLSPGSRFDSYAMSKIYDYTVGLMHKNVENRARIASDVSSMTNSISERFDRLQRNIESGLNEIKAAQILEKNMSGYVDTVVLDFSNNSIFDQQETTATVTDELIIGTVKTPKIASDKSSIRITKYMVNSLSGSMKSDNDITKARVECINSSGIPYIAAKDTEVINSDTRFQLVAESENSDGKRIELKIDKKDNEYFNQIEINLARAHLAMVYTSEDDITYKKAYSKFKYIKDTVVPLAGTTSRFIKIVFNKNKHDFLSNGKNGYRVKFNYLNIVKASVEEVAVMETNDITINGAYSSLCLSTCCNYSDKNVSINYKVSLDGSEWQDIRPVAKINKDTMHPIVIPINNYSNNKLISLKDYTKIDDAYRYSLNLPSDFLISNKVRAFSGDISDGNSEWQYVKGYYVVYGVLNKPAEIELGNTTLEINGKWATGKVSLASGLYRLRIRESNYATIINSRNAELVSELNGEYIVKDDLGTLRTIHDPLYPYNHKMIISQIFDFLFYRELIEKDDYTLYNNETGFNVSTLVPHEEVIIAYRLYEEKLTKLKLRAEMKSLDKNTIPYIEKAFIRLT